MRGRRRWGGTVACLGCIVAVLAATPAASVATSQRAERTLKIIVVAGQSNAEGYESYAIAASGTNLLDGSVADASVPFSFWGDYTTDVSVPPATLTTAQVLAANGKQVFGPEIGMARYLWAHGFHRIAVVKVSHTGASLASWEPGGSLLTTLTARVQALETWEAARNVEASVAGIVWMQGETESLEATEPVTYKAALIAFLPRLRAAVGASSRTPIVLIETDTAAYVDLQRWVDNGVCEPASCTDLLEWNALVRADQVAARHALPHVFIVDSAKYPRTTIQLHLDNTGELDLGNAVGKALAPRL